MKKLIVTVFVLIPVLFVGVGLAQAPGTPASAVKVEKTAPVAAAAPVLARADGLEAENRFLKIDKAQKELDAMKAEFQVFLQTLQKPGYVIAQGPDGKLGYVPEPKKDEPKEPK